MEISVIVPIFNGVKHLDHLIKIFNKQKFRDFEVIFVDDASTDNTKEELFNIKSKSYFNTQIVSLNQNVGSGGARNHGIAAAKGNFLCFIDADDEVSSRYLGELYNKAVETKADLVVGIIEKVWSSGKRRLHYNINEYIKLGQNQEELSCILDDGPTGKLISRELLVKLSLYFPEKIRAEDKAIMPIIYYKANKIEFSPNAVYYYNQTENSRSRSGGQFFNDIFISFKLLEERLNNINPTIIEYKAATIIGYGVLMNAILNNQPNSKLKEYTEFINKNYSKALNNKYLKNIGYKKRLFIKLAYKQKFSLMRVLVKLAK
jgi:glycosyltransferase involved in cell wall biosynthesis